MKADCKYLNSKFMRLIILTGILFSFFLSNSFSYGETSKDKIKVIATTTLIGTMVRTIGEDMVEVNTIVPGGMCPGHFDIKQTDLKNLSEANILLNHGWEKWIENLIKTVENEKLMIKTITLGGNWMVPEVHIQALDEIAKILSQTDPKNSKLYRDSSNNYKKAINTEVLRIQELTKNLAGTKVICSQHQSGFLEWLGFNVVVAYGRAEELTPKKLIKIMKVARVEGVQIVVDNLQSGAKTGMQIAEEIGAKHIVLTNFPLRDSYIESLRENINKIMQTVRTK